VKCPTQFAAHIRRAKTGDPDVRVSPDFQIRVDKDRTALVNLKTGETRIIPANDSGHFDEFEERVHQLDARDLSSKMTGTALNSPVRLNLACCSLYMRMAARDAFPVVVRISVSFGQAFFGTHLRWPLSLSP